MDKTPDKKGNGRRNFFQKLAVWKSPSFQLQEEHFLVERENIGTGLWRATRMFWEYMRGFYAFKDITNCVSVFGSARFKQDHPYYQMAREAGRTLATAGFTVMTGGGPGLMEAANRGAKEGNGLSIGCNIQIPEHPELETPNQYVDRIIALRYFFVRKVMLTKYSSAFVVLPGGIGTLDEFFEMATLIQTGKIKNFPMVLMGKDFWNPLKEFMINVMLKNGSVQPEDINRLLITDSSQEALNYIKDNLNQIVKTNGSK